VKFSTQGLALAGLDLVPPFAFTVRPDPGDDIFDQPLLDILFTEVARVLPGRRLSGIAKVDDQTVFAKLFYGKDARRYWQRELDGARRIIRANVPTPAVLGTGATEDGQGFFIFYSALVGAQPVAEEDLTGITAAVALVAQLHDAKLVQSDPHLNNFVTCDGEYFAIDADGIRGAHLLRQQFANLALLLAQRSPLCDVQIADLWAYYAELRGDYVAKMGNSAVLTRLVHKQRKQRVRRYLRKTQRECTEFVTRRTWRYRFLCDRRHWTKLQRFMLFSEQLFGEGTPLKLGNSATVVRIEVAGQRYIVKRYNLKNSLHRVRRWFKRRSRNAWCNGHRLCFLKIPAARPIALLERKFGWFTGVGYLLMEDCGDRHLGQVLDAGDTLFAEVAPQVVHIMWALKAAGIAHGDLKSSNLVIKNANVAKESSAPDPEVKLIDYDGLKDGDALADKRRFLANWEPPLRQTWEKLLAEAGL
jgi:tRNA A-37 threonylcarbamoyl transferase component Bud32